MPGINYLIFTTQQNSKIEETGAHELLIVDMRDGYITQTVIVPLLLKPTTANKTIAIMRNSYASGYTGAHQANVIYNSDTSLSFMFALDGSAFIDNLCCVIIYGVK